MNKYVVKGFNIWKIFIKNKVASSIMMLISGVMMLIAAINGKGNDTKTLPMVILLVGVVLSFWSFYRIGYIKSNYDKHTDRNLKVFERQCLFAQIPETVIYLIVVGLGLFLILNESFTNRVLNLMSGCFTILNSVFGAIFVYKKRENKNFKWKFRIVLTLVELVVGVYFIVASDSINQVGFTIMGCLTTVAGAIEVFSSINAESLKNTVEDGKEIVKTLKEN